MPEQERKQGRTCAVMQHHEFLVNTNERYCANRRAIEANTAVARVATRTTVIRIPVVVHVIHHTDRENLSEDQIHSQIAALNRDFRLQNADRADVPNAFRGLMADTLIEFALAVRDPEGNSTSGITRTRTSREVFPYDPSDRDATDKLDALVKDDRVGKSAWPRDSYLNLWVCSIQNGLLGYAQFPGGPAATDGVVILNTAFGSGGIAAAPYNLGRTAVHEVGHWLNLLHIWGDDGGGCTRSDNVEDTPNQANSNGSDVRKSSFPHISCNNGPNGDMFMNYMDYVDDETMVMFTRGQLARMNATLSGPRSSLASSKGLTPVTQERAMELAPVILAANLRHEDGSRPETVFDGVTWVPVEG